MDESKANSDNSNVDTANETASAAKQINLKVQIGHVYSVKRQDGEWYPAEVLEKRELKGKSIEYFVHFENCNRLLFVYLSLNINYENLSQLIKDLTSGLKLIESMLQGEKFYPRMRLNSPMSSQSVK